MQTNLFSIWQGVGLTVLRRCTYKLWILPPGCSAPFIKQLSLPWGRLGCSLPAQNPACHGDTSCSSARQLRRLSAYSKTSSVSLPTAVSFLHFTFCIDLLPCKITRDQQWGDVDAFQLRVAAGQLPLCVLIQPRNPPEEPGHREHWPHNPPWELRGGRRSARPYLWVRMGLNREIDQFCVHCSRKA